MKELLEQPFSLALCGGGAMGFCHLGVVNALEKRGYHPEAIAGTSMGALVGALFAYPDAKPAIDVGMLDFFAAILTRGWTFRARLRRIFGNATIGDCAIPFTACVALKSDPFKPIYLDDPNLPLWWVVAASCALPFVFAPVEIEGNRYMDGGPADNMPCVVLRKLGFPIIGVEAGFLEVAFRDDDVPTGWKAQKDALRVARYRDTGDALIRPDLHTFTPQSFGNFPAIVTAGYECVEELFEDEREEQPA